MAYHLGFSNDASIGRLDRGKLSLSLRKSYVSSRNYLFYLTDTLLNTTHKFQPDELDSLNDESMNVNHTDSVSCALAWVSNVSTPVVVV